MIKEDNIKRIDALTNKYGYNINSKKKDWEKVNVIYCIEVRRGKGKKTYYYIGKAKNGLINRLYTHLMVKNDTVRSALEENNSKNLKVYVIEECASESEMDKRELYWIKHYFFSGYRLLNRDYRKITECEEYFKKINMKAIHFNRQGVIRYTLQGLATN